MDTTQKFKSAYSYAQQNPQSEFATELRKRIEAGQYQNEIKTLGINVPTTGAPQVAEQGGFGSETINDIKQVGTGIAEDFNKRKEQAAATTAAFKSGEQGIGQTALQAVGQGAGLVSDVVGNVIKGGVKAVLPQGVEDAANTGIQTVAKPIIESSPVQSVIERYKKLQETNPALARDIDSALGIASLGLDVAGLGVGSVGANAVKNTVKEVGGEALEQVAKTGSKLSSKVDSAVLDTKSGLGNILETTGQKIQTSVLKPTTRDIKDGFKVANVTKYDVGGSLPETVAKSHTKMNQLSQQLAEKLKSSDAKIDLNEAYEDTVKKLLGDKTKTFGDNSAIERVLKNLKSEIKSSAPESKVDLIKGTNIKRGAGTKGAWAYNRPEADASAIEKVYSEFYGVLKNKIEKAAPPGVKEINKQISELIPINNAALRRMTVEERNNVINFTENLGLISSIFDPKALLLVGANRALRSGTLGNKLSEIGGKLKK